MLFVASHIPFTCLTFVRSDRFASQYAQIYPSLRMPTRKITKVRLISMRKSEMGCHKLNFNIIFKI